MTAAEYSLFPFFFAQHNQNHGLEVVFLSFENKNKINISHIFLTINVINSAIFR